MKSCILGISVLTALLIFASPGCGRKGRWERVIVHGKVTFQGQPVQLGRIRFVPTDGSRGPVTIDMVEEGQYTTRSTGGVPLGTHRVEITGFDPDEYKNAPTGPGAPPVRQLLPARYNRQSELKIVLEAGPRTQKRDFELE